MHAAVLRVSARCINTPRTSINCTYYHAGSHTVLALLENGYRVTIIENFDNAFEECFARMQRLAGDKAAKMKLIKVPHRLSCR
jgi:UDP-glucose 4-epimerase